MATEHKLSKAIEDILFFLNTRDKIREVCESVFNGVDTDSSGFIEIGELEAAMNTIAKGLNNPPPSQQEVLEVWNEIDRDGDGQISLSEFCSFVIQVVEHLTAKYGEDGGP
mmetsp:Transcript_25385/g.29042  ORF Transcript_25385/g.29042 Transcript_25385/m.29042 type:complete len:111 (+) Transcript_25385:43-375(+)